VEEKGNESVGIEIEIEAEITGTGGEGMIKNDLQRKLHILKNLLMKMIVD
jgi:hypothetical protein